MEENAYFQFPITEQSLCKSMPTQPGNKLK